MLHLATKNVAHQESRECLNEDHLKELAQGRCRQHVTLAGLEVPHAVATSESNQRQGTSEDFFCPATREKPLVCLSPAETLRMNFGPEQMHASQ